MPGIILLLHKVLVVLINAIGIWLGFWVLLAGRRKRANQFFFLSTLSLLLWINFSFLFNFSLDTPTAYFWGRLNIVSVIFFFIFIYFFSLYFPQRKKSSRLLNLMILSLLLFFIFVFSFGKLGIKGVEKEIWGRNVLGGPLLPLFYAFLFILTLLILYNLLRGYVSSTREDKLKIQYFLFGGFLFAAFNIIFNIIFPLFRGSFKYSQFGDYSAIFFLGFAAFSIAKRELFGIKIILVETLVSLVATLLFLQIFLSKTLFQTIFGISLFILFLIVGFILTRLVFREIEQKKKLKESLQEIQRLNATLEEKVKSKTADLQEKVEDLEKFYKLTIGREEKMAELKERVKQLEEEIRKKKS